MLGLLIAVAIALVLAGILYRFPNVWLGIFSSIYFLGVMAWALWTAVVYAANWLASFSLVAGVLVLGIVALTVVGLFFAAIIYLIRNTSVMQQREGRSFTAKLSALFGGNFLMMMPVLWIFTQTDIAWLRIVMATIFWEDMFFSALFFGYLIYSAFNQFLTRPNQVDYFIILGSWSGRDGIIPPLLKSRVDKALARYFILDQQPKFVVSGGLGPKEEQSEAAVMAHYLESRGVPATKILLEDQSHNTYQNMFFSKAIIDADWQGTTPPAVVFSTSNYHVLRASIFARKAGLNARGIGAPTSLFFLPSALIREFIGILAYYRWRTALLVVGLAALNIWSFWPR